jgi:hypothetical protein
LEPTNTNIALMFFKSTRTFSIMINNIILERPSKKGIKDSNGFQKFGRTIIIVIT